MERKRVLLITLAPVLLLVLTVGYLYAQGPDTRAEPGRNEGGIPQAPLGSGFTYQGQLKDSGGNPIDDTCDLTFGLWDAQSGGSQVGSDSVVTGVAVTNGYFAALVNGGGEFGAGAFAGEGRWLEIAVQCTGDPSPVVLSPRQRLSAAPYAFSLRPGAVISGRVASGNSLEARNSDPDGIGVFGWVTAISGTNYGVWGESASTEGSGVFGLATASSGTNYGVHGLSNSADGSGVFGESASPTGRGVEGLNNATAGEAAGVYGRSSSTDGAGVFGWAFSTSGANYGVWGESASTEGSGVFGLATASSGTTYGVYGQSDSNEGLGVLGVVMASSGTTYGVYGVTASNAGSGVYGYASATSGTTYGVYGLSASFNGRGVTGYASGSGGLNFGVYGESDSISGRGVSGYASASSGITYGVYGSTVSPSGYAGYFLGDVHVEGTLSKTGGSFKIDHPLDPASKYLYHSFVESPDMKNVYDGVVVLDEQGSAWVELPAWFEALNRDFRYQLTPIGGPAPSLYVAQEIQDDRFLIAGGTPGLKVSWQVTGIRQDPWAEAHRIPVEVDKPADERGTYLYPELYGQPEELGLDYQRNQGREESAGPEVPVPVALPE